MDDGLKEENAVALALATKNLEKLEGKVDGRLTERVTGKTAELNYSKDRNENDEDAIAVGLGTPNAHLLAEFALQLFYTHLKKVKITLQDQLALSMLDPMVDIFFRFCLPNTTRRKLHF